MATFGPLLKTRKFWSRAPVTAWTKAYEIMRELLVLSEVSPSLRSSSFFASSGSSVL